ncbi:MCE family protein [Phaeacidiphilus oryzae]|uniref:MCE family protein n=1 Tax=Phaeacidiphilus oryzae TaxID=348818 RepID=UPI00056809B4|nr:MlaD family protein [Phaeacidiphilus oryzae]
MGAAIRFGVFALLMVLVTGGLAVLVSNADSGPVRTYHAVFTDVTGLSDGDDVRVAGVRVGKVTGIGVHGEDQAEVSFTVSTSRPLLVSTGAVIRYRDLLGRRYLALTEGPGDGAELPGGSTIPLSRTRPALDLDVLLDGFKPLFAALSPGDVNQLASEIIQVFQGEGGTMTTLLTQTAQLTGTLADRDQLIGSVVDNLDRLLGTLDRRSSQFDGLLTQLQRLVGGLAQDRQAVGDSLGGIDSLASATAGLTQQARPDLRADLSQLNTLAGALAANDGQFQQTVRQLPGRAQSLIGAASYGSWFNFYLCDLRGAVTLPTLGQVRIPALRYTTARCPQ